MAGGSVVGAWWSWGECLPVLNDCECDAGSEQGLVFDSGNSASRVRLVTVLCVLTKIASSHFSVS